MTRQLLYNCYGVAILHGLDFNTPLLRLQRQISFDARQYFAFSTHTLAKQTVSLQAQ